MQGETAKPKQILKLSLRDLTSQRHSFFNLNQTIMEFKGTKGKWKFYEGPEGFIVSELYGVGVAVMSKSSISNPHHTKHNAKLIAKAPEMLEMLNKLIPVLRDRHLYESANAVEKLIKEATE